MKRKILKQLIISSLLDDNELTLTITGINDNKLIISLDYGSACPELLIKDKLSLCNSVFTIVNRTQYRNRFNLVLFKKQLDKFLDKIEYDRCYNYFHQ